MAWAGRYLDTTTEAKLYQIVPLSAPTIAILEQACADGENEIDKYLAGKGIATPITLTGLATAQQLQLKRVTAKMIGYVLYSQHSQRGVASDEKKAAEGLLDEFIAEADLSHTTVQSGLGIVNYQKEYIDDWDDPNDTLENMDE